MATQKSPLTAKEQDTFCRLLKKIHDGTQTVPEDIIAQAKEILAFCRKHIPEDGQEWTFRLGRESFSIKTDTNRRGFNWNKHYHSHEVDIHYTFKWSAKHQSAYHNDSIRVETALILGEREFPFGLPNPVRLEVKL